MKLEDISLTKRAYFASDFHLGLAIHTAEEERLREARIISWLDAIAPDAQVLFLLGDLFDFWYEYRHTIPKGFVRFQARLAQFTDDGIPVHVFTGNHDMWMFDYLQKELGVYVHFDPCKVLINKKQFLIGHGDGLGPGDRFYKIMKRIFRSGAARFSFSWIHPNLGISLARKWSKSSRLGKADADLHYYGDDEYLVQYCKEIEQQHHHDYYIFGHRHLPLDVPIGDHSRYFNLGEWVNHNTYGVFDGQHFELKKMES
jgi:UDP-2,3-diacylglucosamine hydrolase